MKTLYFVLGCICLGIGAVGAVLPVLPTTVFLLCAAFFFGRSSKKISDWFVSTKIYKDNLESFIEKRGMTIRTKTSIMISFSLVILLAYFMMRNVPISKFILPAVWICHILYFMFGVKTISQPVEIIVNSKTE